MAGWGGSALPFPGTSIPRVPYPVSFPGFSHPLRLPLPGAIPEEQLLSCGANDCLMATAPGNSTQRPSQELIYTLLGIYTGVWGTERVSCDLIPAFLAESYRSLSSTQGRVPIEAKKGKGLGEWAEGQRALPP